MEQLLLVTSCDSLAGIGASLRTGGRTDGRTHGWTDRRDVANSILDEPGSMQRDAPWIPLHFALSALRARGPLSKAQ